MCASGRRLEPKRVIFVATSLVGRMPGLEPEARKDGGVSAYCDAAFILREGK